MAATCREVGSEKSGGGGGRAAKGDSVRLSHTLRFLGRHFLGGIWEFWTEKGLGKAGIQITQSMSFSGQTHAGFSIKIVDFNQIPHLDP